MILYKFKVIFYYKTTEFSLKLFYKV